MRTLLSFAASCGMFLTGVAVQAEATEYLFTPIDYPGADSTWVWDINDSGQIVGNYLDGNTTHAFILSGGVYTSFDYPTTQGGTSAHGINNLGQIVGDYPKNGATLGAYLRDGDEYHTLPQIRGTHSTWSSAARVNDSANVAGWYKTTSGADRAFVFDGTSYATFNDPDAVRTYAWGINNDGVIVGAGWEVIGYPHALLRDANGVLTTFLVGGWYSEATDINDWGQILGNYGPELDECYGYVLSGGIDSTPDRIQVPGATMTEALGINNLGQVVGHYTFGTFNSGARYGYLATPIATADFDKDGDVDGADLALWQGDYGLNANCDADGDGDTDGRDFLIWQRQFIAGTPGLANELGIPEPATLWLALMALAGSGRAARNTF